MGYCNLENLDGKVSEYRELWSAATFLPSSLLAGLRMRGRLTANKLAGAQAAALQSVKSA